MLEQEITKFYSELFKFDGEDNKEWFKKRNLDLAEIADYTENFYKKILAKKDIVIKSLVEDELERATIKFGEFHSAHEGYAVILEEYQETEHELKEIKEALNYLWDCIKENDTNYNEYINEYSEKYAMNLIKESIQVYAMLLKLKQFTEKK